MLADYHVHTPYCGHAHGKVIQYVHSAISSGLHEIGFSDHLGRYYLSKSQKRRYWDWGMDEKNIGRYYSELSDLQEIFSKEISIKIGLEVDYIEGAEELLKPLLTASNSILSSVRFTACPTSVGNTSPIFPNAPRHFLCTRNISDSPALHCILPIVILWRIWILSGEMFHTLSALMTTSCRKLLRPYTQQHNSTAASRSMRMVISGQELTALPKPSTLSCSLSIRFSFTMFL